MEIAHAYNSSYADLARGVKDRVVLITGAASGIGRLATLEYLKLGAKVAAGDINHDTLKTLASECEATGFAGNLFTCTVNVTKYDELYDLFFKTQEKFGRIDVVCANAGINPGGDFMSSKVPANVRPDMKVIDVNFVGVLYTSHLAVRFFRENTTAKASEKCLILTGSMASFQAMPSVGMPYSASKAAVLSLSQSLAIQGVAEGFRCNCINPWFADTNILDKAARLVLKGIPLAPIHAITQAFILATATEATDQAWVIDEHGLWELPNPSIKSKVVDQFMSRFVIGLKLKKALQRDAYKRYLSIAAIAAGAVAVVWKLFN